MDLPRVTGVAPSSGGATTSNTSQPTAASTPRALDPKLVGSMFEMMMQQQMVQSVSAMDIGGGSEESGGDSDGMGDLGGAQSSGGGADMMQMMLPLMMMLLGGVGGASGGGSGAAQAQLSQLLGAVGAAGASAGANSEAGLGQSLLSGADSAQLNAPVSSAGGAGQQSIVDNARTVATVARQKGVDPVAAIAMMLVESGGNNHAVGDGGTSFGLFQLHQGGMLGSLSREQAFNPATNAGVSLGSLAKEWANGSRVRTPGQICAASQRPADPAGYARKVDGMMDRARQLLAQCSG